MLFGKSAEQGPHPATPSTDPIGDPRGPMADPKSPAFGVEPGAPTCRRQRWLAWRHEHRDHHLGHDHHHEHIWWHHHRHFGPQQPSAASGDPGAAREWTPQEWQHWREQQWCSYCPFRSGRFSRPAVPKDPLDESRWLENYFAWY